MTKETEQFQRQCEQQIAEKDRGHIGTYYNIGIDMLLVVVVVACLCLVSLLQFLQANPTAVAGAKEAEMARKAEELQAHTNYYYQ